MNAAIYSNTKYTPSRPFVTKFEISIKGVHSLIKIRMEMQAHNKAEFVEFFLILATIHYLLLFLEFFLTSGAAAVTKNINACKVAVTLVSYSCNSITEFFGFSHTLFTG